ncbi:MAG TPA: DUF6776 family protein [Gammaproteobacteria bacterium]
MRRVGPLYFAGIGLVVLAGMVYLAFELGRLEAGYSILDQRREQEALQLIVESQIAEADDLQRQLTMLRTSQEIDRETYAQIEMSLAELQQRIQEQEEELAFYQGIISPEDGYPGLRVQTLAISPAEAERHYELRLVLVQAIVQDRRVTGTVRMNIDGVSGGVPARLSVADLHPEDDTSELAYSFRYFQGLQQEIVLPRDFEPRQVNVEIRPADRGDERILHSFEWAAVTG